MRTIEELLGELVAASKEELRFAYLRRSLTREVHDCILEREEDLHY